MRPKVHRSGAAGDGQAICDHLDEAGRGKTGAHNGRWSGSPCASASTGSNLRAPVAARPGGTAFVTPA